MASLARDNFFAFYILKKECPEDWGNIVFNVLPMNSEGKIYTNWIEVAENYIKRTEPTDYKEMLESLKVAKILHIPISSLIEEISEDIFWIHLWIRDLNDNPPLDVKEKYIEFANEYNKESRLRFGESRFDTKKDKFFTTVRWGAINLLSELMKFTNFHVNYELLMNIASECNQTDIIKLLEDEKDNPIFLKPQYYPRQFKLNTMQRIERF